MAILPETSGIYQTFLFHKPTKPRKEPVLLYFGHTISERTVRKETDRCARALLRWGIKPRSAVFLCQNQTPELLYSLLAIWQLGGVAHLINPNAPPKILKECFLSAKGDLFLLSEGFAHRFSGIVNEEASVQTVLIPLTQSLPLLQHRRIRNMMPPPSASLTSSRLLLWKEFLESGKSLYTSEPTPISPETTAVFYYPPFAATSGLSLSHGQICKATERLRLQLPLPQKGARLLSQQKPWYPESLSALLLPFCTDLCLLLEPRNSNSATLSTVLTADPNYLLCDRSFCLWLNEQGIAAATLSHLFVLQSEVEDFEESASLS